MDPLGNLLDQVRTTEPAEARALAAHDLLGRLQLAVEEVADLRGQAVASLRGEGWSHQQVADLLGVHRNRAAHIGR